MMHRVATAIRRDPLALVPIVMVLATAAIIAADPGQALTWWNDVLAFLTHTATTLVDAISNILGG